MLARHRIILAADNNTTGPIALSSGHKHSVSGMWSSECINWALWSRLQNQALLSHGRHSRAHCISYSGRVAHKRPLAESLQVIHDAQDSALTKQARYSRLQAALTCPLYDAGDLDPEMGHCHADIREYASDSLVFFEYDKSSVEFVSSFYLIFFCGATACTCADSRPGAFMYHSPASMAACATLSMSELLLVAGYVSHAFSRIASSPTLRIS